MRICVEQFAILLEHVDFDFFSTVFIHTALDIASSLKYLHRDTIAHHDLKPENKHFGV